LQSFIEHFTGNASALFRFSGNTSAASPLSGLLDVVQSGDEIDDADLWDGPNASWIGCSQQPGGKCFGGMKRAEWYSAERGTHCVNKFTDLVKDGKLNESTVELDICTLDASLNDLCVKLKNALLKIQTGNCLVTGGCQPKTFVYAPGMYSQSNQDFVRGTVINFYERYGLQTANSFSFGEVLNADLVCPMDNEEEDMRKRNTELTQYCASRQLEILQDSLKIARRVVHIIVEVSYIQMQLMFAFFRLLIPGLDSMLAVVHEIEFWFMQLVNIIFESLKEIGNLIFKIVSNMGGAGNAMKTLVNVLCRTFNVALTVYNFTVCEIMKNVIAPICQIMLDLLKPIVNFFGGDTAIFDLLDRVVDTIKSSNCNETITCDELGVTLPDEFAGSLPVTSRCWADYTPNVDDSSSYACSRSDTCSNADLSYGVTSQVNFSFLLSLS
jgi:hypothetical protein